MVPADTTGFDAIICPAYRNIDALRIDAKLLYCIVFIKQRQGLYKRGLLGEGRGIRHQGTEDILSANQLKVLYGRISKQ